MDRGTIAIGAASSQPDSITQRFYEKLGEIFSTWIPLEDVYYRNTEFGEFDHSKDPKFPEFEYFHTTIAKNGGPIAMMI